MRVALQGGRERPPGGGRADRPTDRAAHVGYHLIDRRPPRSRGRRSPIGPPFATAVRRLLFAHATGVYLGADRGRDRAARWRAAVALRCGTGGSRGRQWSSRRCCVLLPGERHRDRAASSASSAAVLAPRRLPRLDFTERRARRAPARWSSCRRC